jgi:hypothetical protein
MDWMLEHLFDGTNYVIWSIRMKTYLQALGYDVWKSIVTGYTPSKTPPTDATGKEACENNTMAMNSILSGLVDSEKSKVGQCTSTKELWDKLQDIYAKQGALDMLKWTKEEENKVDNSDSESDVEEANISRNPKRGSGKYKGMPII